MLSMKEFFFDVCAITFKVVTGPQYHKPRDQEEERREYKDHLFHRSVVSVATSEWICSRCWFMADHKVCVSPTKDVKTSECHKLAEWKPLSIYCATIIEVLIIFGFYRFIFNIAA